MIKLKNILLEIDNIKISKFLNKWVDFRNQQSFPKILFTTIQKKYPNSVKNGLIYRSIIIPQAELKTYKTEKDIKKFIYDNALKRGYSSYSKNKIGVLNFNDILSFDDDFTGKNNTDIVILISQKSEYIDLFLFKKLFGRQQYEIIKDTQEVIAKINKNFSILGIYKYPNQLISIHTLFNGNTDSNIFFPIYNLIRELSIILFPLKTPGIEKFSVPGEEDKWKKFENNIYNVKNIAKKVETIEDLENYIIDLLKKFEITVDYKEVKKWLNNEFKTFIK